MFNKKQKDKWVHEKGVGYVARLVVSGVIEDENKTYNQQWILDTISELKEDADNKGIALFINSPGGGVYQADEVYLALLDYSASGKPVYAYMGPLAASGGYYISCGAKYIMANRNTLTGSIGVLAGQFVDATGLLEKMGIKSETIHAGKNKNMGSFNEPVTDEQRRIMQSIADECYDQFVQIVSKARGMPVSSVRSLADGRIYTAKQAKENFLIDAIGSFDELVEYMGKTEFAGEVYSVEDFEYEEEPSFYSYLTGMAASLKGPSIFSSLGLPPQTESALTQSVPYPAYFYDGMLSN
ncbi:MAG: signal peptide peptidase SppA [Treponema sp.]|nr:signal peptide peptidase SppA [Treponema sp.]